jgi:hypothetical protein
MTWNACTNYSSKIHNARKTGHTTADSDLQTDDALLSDFLQGKRLQAWDYEIEFLFYSKV